MKRSLESTIISDPKNKITLISGPRQAGKTTMVQSLVHSLEYINFDQSSHRKILREQSWDRETQWVIFDELHKMHNWKSWLKGVYDTRETDQRIIVAGSARLDIHKKAGDSLAGRFFRYRLHPLDVQEAVWSDSTLSSSEALDRIMNFGGFPEPFLKASRRFYGKWQQSHLDIILRHDLVQIENIRDMVSVETLVQMMRERIGSPLSHRNIAEDLQKDDKTVKKWLQTLESLFVVFKIQPYHKNIARSQLKMPKYYFYDVGQVTEDNLGARFENLVACALLKRCHYYTDVEGESHEIFYLRNRQKDEIDFLITRKKKPFLMVEAKANEDSLSKSAHKFKNYFPTVPYIQLSLKKVREKSWAGGFELRNADHWLTTTF